MNRRDFFAAVTAAAVAASAGINLRPDQKRLIANYRRVYDMHFEQYVHRFSVRADGNAYYVDCMTPEEELPEHAVEPMLKALEQYIGEEVTVATT